MKKFEQLVEEILKTYTLSSEKLLSYTEKSFVKGSIDEHLFSKLVLSSIDTEIEKNRKKNYLFHDHKSQVEALKSFISELIDEVYKYHTYNIEAGKKYLADAVKQIDLNKIKKTASIELEMKLAECEEILGTEKTKELIAKSWIAEPAMIDSAYENEIYKKEIGTISFKIPLDVAGMVKGTAVSDLYNALGEGLYEDEVEAIKVPLRADWDIHSDIIEIPAPKDAWIAVIDEDLFEKALAEEKKRLKVADKMKFKIA